METVAGKKVKAVIDEINQVNALTDRIKASERRVPIG